MGCVFCSLGSFMSIVLDALERISLCTVCAMLTCCLALTLITVMVMGIGIGFHYCFVQNSVDAMAAAAEAAGTSVSKKDSVASAARRMGPSSVLRSVDKAVRKFNRGRAKRHAEEPADLNQLPADPIGHVLDHVANNTDTRFNGLKLLNILNDKVNSTLHFLQ